MLFFCCTAPTGFSYVFRALGGDDLMIATLAVLIFLLGFPFEWIEICLIVLPVFTPILSKLNFTDHIGQTSYFMA
jgi:TRAP-type mannitol/chloroaromatic compound transport system permease large subunit